MSLSAQVAGPQTPAGWDPTRIVVAVDGSASGTDALDWAAVQAAEHGAELRIVHGVNAILSTWPLPPVTSAQVATVNQADELVRGAVDRVRAALPALQVSGHVDSGTTESAILRAVSPQTLVVVGNTGRCADAATVAGVLRRARVPVAVVKLTGQAEHGRSEGQIVVVSGRGRRARAAVAAALAEAKRRGVGVSALMATEHPAADIATESQGAALVVIPLQRREPRQLFHRRHRPTSTLVHAAATPVLLVPDKPH